MGVLSALLFAAPLVLHATTVEGSRIPLNTDRQAFARDVETPKLPQALANEAASARVSKEPTDFVPDGKTCCPSGQEPTAYATKNDRCEYGSHVSAYVSQSDDKVTRCCFDVHAPKFYVHYFDLDKGFKFPVDIHGSSQHETGFCNLGLKYDISDVIVADNWISLHINLNVDCATYNKSDKEWITIFFNRNYRHSGRFTYVITGIGPTIYADVAAKIIGDDTVGLEVHVTGTGIIGRLDETVRDEIRNDVLKGFLKGKEICL
ncbi:hypothetical protein BBO_07008 [Beauveria brongniartii RCEF 3172]|uniref:Uncharacterized protein n=1 Tax=Beauveria brongniartii RCEF 3172 TaxID=1081107 RepID=A0A167AC63_9HYPO|nr:hypothetical protein BBO_07008 [Beauveria brongniartii RCEF 3172]